MSIFSNTKSEYFYSDYQASLADGAEIDSGWLDMETADKYQFEGLASASGMTQVIESSSNADGAGSTVTSTNANTAAFQLFNVIARQRYMRFKWQNNTGGTLTDVSMSIKASYGSSDKLSVFPLSTAPANFSQAALVRSVSTGQQPDGDYVNDKQDGSAFNSSSTLSADATYTSSWVDSDGWNSIELFIATDVESAEQGIEIEYTDDSQAVTPSVKATKKYTFRSADVTRGFITLRVPPILDGFRVKYTNGSTAQSSFFLDTTLKTNSDNTSFNSGGAVLTSEFLTEVALGNISNYQVGTKFGRNPAISTGTTPEDMWNGGGNYTGHPTDYTPETVDVFSSDADDDDGDTGARTIRIFGLKTSTSTEYEHEDITMNGTTAVTSSNTWWRINRAVVLTAGSSGENEGTITVRATTTTANVFVQLPVGFNQSTIGAFTVPAGKTMLIKRVRVSITRSSGSAGSSTISLRSRPSGGVYNAVRVFELQTGAPTEFTSLGGIVASAGSDVKFRIEDVSDNSTVAEGAFEYVLIDN